MRTSAVCLLLASVVVLATADAPFPPIIELLSRSEVRDEHGQYSLSYSASNGIVVEEHGELKPTPDGKDYVLVRSGSYSYPSEAGEIKTTYIADENGFRAEGNHLPKPVQPIV